MEIHKNAFQVKVEVRLFREGLNRGRRFGLSLGVALQVVQKDDQVGPGSEVSGPQFNGGPEVIGSEVELLRPEYIESFLWSQLRQTVSGLNLKRNEKCRILVLLKPKFLFKIFNRFFASSFRRNFRP
jgi:hypothetical protein